MARRKKGRPLHGWLVIDKPLGLTSSAVVNKAKWAFDAQKAGHAGTLDPEATGVLAIAFGEATKTVPYVTDSMKAYRFTVRLGQGTNTDDGEGEIIARSDKRPSADEVRAALPSFTGDIMQIPPQFSAVKVDGERAYKRARDGQEMNLKARPLLVDSLKLVEMPDADHAVLEMVCGKGGYVRSIARDLGHALGCYAHVVQLHRIWAGPFEIEDSIPFEKLDEMAKNPALDAFLLPLEAGLNDVEELVCTPEGAAKLRNGNPGMVLAANVEYGDECWASLDGVPVAIGVYKAGELHPNRVFVLEGEHGK